MKLAYACILISACMPYVWITLTKATIRYNNRTPRAQQEGLTGWRQRAYWAQMNSFEAFAPFAAAVLVAIQAGVAADTVDALALTFVVARALYGVCYIKDWHVARSLVWFVGIGVVVALFVLALSR
ncbi:MAPEG family protein [Chitinimonas lacunae]|uniref:MAPEG family protein n=1 Tax=Chitinimonas lacunae TaxID=1963018 RepID=A0ABV8MP39_9NEIS